MVEATKTPSEITALKEAVRHTDISLFGPLFDVNLSRISFENPSLEREELEKRAFDATLAHEFIQRVGIDAVVASYQDRRHGTIHFSEAAKAFLERFMNEKSAG